MHFLYLDASGGDDWPPPIGSSPTKFYVLAGLAIQPEYWDNAYSEITKLIEKFFPNPNKRPKELHYSELVARKGVFGLLSELERKKLADEVFRITKSIKPTLFAVVIDKLKHYHKYSEPEPPKQLALRFIAPHFSKFLQRRKDVGIMIYDTTQARSDMFLRHFLEKARSVGIVLQTWEDPLRTQNQSDNVVESIFFLESHLSPIIQLVDFCAYAVFCKYERGRNERFNEIYSLFDRDDNTIWGLIEWPR